MITDFTAIDFETAQGARNSICAIGLVRVEKNQIVKTIDLLIKPPQNQYFWKNTEIHGIDADMTKNSLTFDNVWNDIKPYIQNQHVVAHNGAFDFDVLSKTLTHYGIELPEYSRHCTYKIFGKALNICCQRYHIELNHHNALSDAIACAKLFMIHLSDQ